MQTIISTFLGCVLACTISAAAWAQPQHQSTPAEPGPQKPWVHRSVRQLEKAVQELQARVEVLEATVYQNNPVCPCFNEYDLVPLTLESCEVTSEGTVHGQGQQTTITVGKSHCTLQTPHANVNLPITTQEQWVCILPVLSQMAKQDLPCAIH
jgi:hypothetical protein